MAITSANRNARELGGRDTDFLTANSITVFFDATHGASKSVEVCELEFFGRDVHASGPTARFEVDPDGGV